MWEIKRERLIEGLEILAKVPDKLGIPSSEYFWVRGKGSKVKLSVASYISGEIELEGKGSWPIAGDFYVDRRVFLPFIYAAREIKNKNRFEFDKHKKQLCIRHGRRKAYFDSQTKVKGYGNLKKILLEKSSSFPASDDLKELLMCGRNCAVSDSVVPHLNCVYISKSSKGMSIEAYAASDKVFYLGVGKIDKGSISKSTPFPLFLISLLGEPGLQKISWIGNYIVLKFEHGVIWQPISEEALTEFPKRRIVKHAKKADKLPVTFVSSSRRFSRLMIRLGYYLQSVRRKDWVVSLEGKKGKSAILVDTNIPGSNFIERITTSEPIKKNFRLEWPLDVLEPVFDFLSKKTKKLAVVVRMDDKHGISYVRAGNYWLAVPGRQE